MSAPTVVDAIARILRAEGVELLSAYPTTPVIDAAARVGIRPVLCRQERVGVGIADGYARVAGDGRFGVFACQFEDPGIENAFSGVASAFSDGTPVLVLAMANAVTRAQTPPLFRAEHSFAAITKSCETILAPRSTADVMRRAISALRNGPPGPVLVEIPADVGDAEAPARALEWTPVVATRSAADPDGVRAALDALLAAESPVVLAGNGVLQAQASAELVELAELLQLPVLTTVAGKSAFPERHPLSLGAVGVTASDVALEQLAGADLVLALGTSLTLHFMSPRLPRRATLIHVTVAARDLAKSHATAHPLLGDARLVLRQLLELAHARERPAGRDDVAQRIADGKRAWRARWEAKLTSDERPITPYRVLHELMRATDPDETIVTHDSGSPRDQMTPFYEAGGPRTYLGWGKSHALGAGLGLALGAKLAAPDKLCVHWHGDAAFGMTGLDVETAARCGIPIVSLVLNNSHMAIETTTLLDSHELYATRDISGDYTALARSLGVDARRVEDPAELADAFAWAKQITEGGRPALVEVITSVETDFSNRVGISH